MKPSLLSENLKLLRRVKGVTLRDVERATMISNSYLSQIETGKNINPTLSVLTSLSKYFKVTIEELTDKKLKVVIS